MMIVVLFALSFFVCAGNTPQIVQVREMYANAPLKESACKEMLKKLESATIKEPLFYGYRGCAMMIMAKHAFNPFNKWAHFKKGRSMLEQAIAAEPLNIELRYLRFMVQSNTPAFLGYKSQIAKDRAFIRNNMNSVTDKQLFSMIQSVI